MTNPSAQVQPPANGKKLWRVKRSVSTGNPASVDNDSLLECMNNSLKISAAGKQYMVKRPPLKRPKSKPGMPKDFVFVDLSPVKSSDDAESEASSVSSSPVTLYASSTFRPLPTMNESFGTDEEVCTQAAEFAYAAPMPMFDEQALLGLGLMNVNYDYGTQPTVDYQYQDQLAMQRLLAYQTNYLHMAPMPQAADARALYAGPQPVLPVSPITHHRSKLTLAVPRRKSSGGFQFKTYKGPKAVKKPTPKKHRRCVSEPSAVMAAAAAGCTADTTYPQEAPAMDDVLSLSDSLLASVDEIDFAYTPLTDLSENEGVDYLMKPHMDNFSFQKDEYDLLQFFAV